MSFVRQSKFRHIFGQAFKTEKCYNGLKTEGTGDTNCAVSGKFIAMIKASKIFILPLDKTGRQEENQLPYIDLKGKVLDVQWSPFDDCLLASGDDVGGVHIWEIPEGGLKETVKESFVTVSDDYHRRKITCLQWHPSARNIIAVTGADQIVTIWNVTDEDTAAQPLTVIEDIGEIPINVAWNCDGSTLGVTAKVNKAMSLILVNPHTAEIIKKKEAIYNGMKAAKLAFLNNGDIVTCGADKSASRSIFIWGMDCNGEIEEKRELELDDGSGVLNLYYDSDLCLLYTFAKGETVLKYYEIDEKTSEIFYLSAYSSTVSQKGGNFMPKRCVDTSTTEIAKFYKFQPSRCEPVSFIVPRKSDHFQKDLYPACSSSDPSLEADEWAKGIDKAPKKMEFGSSNVTAKREPRVTVKSAPRKTASKAAPTKTQEAVEVVAADGTDIAELLEDMKKVKATVRKLNKRVTKLEEMLEQQGVDAKEEEEEEEE